VSTSRMLKAPPAGLVTGMEILTVDERADALTVYPSLQVPNYRDRIAGGSCSGNDPQCYRTPAYVL
jgi:hypothetical protein